jgi:Rad3-related DNA helicase
MTEAPLYATSVRALCEFTAKRGDLDRRFTPAPSARDGMEGHEKVRLGRPREYQREVPLSGRYDSLEVRGRADGYDPGVKRLEEIKTYRGDLERQPDNHRHLHWAQAKIYGWLLCDREGLPAIRLALVYFNIDSGQETLLEEIWEADALQRFFDDSCQRFLHWARQETAHRQRRNRALEKLDFPYPDFRTGQRQVAESVYKAVRTDTCLQVEAATGIGKTLATVFPALKAAPARGLDKVYFLAAKTSGRQLALDTLRRLDPSPAANDQHRPVRVLELTAREKTCEYPGTACSGDTCPLASGFYDRLPDARQAAADKAWLDRDALRSLALAHAVCPYYLAQEMVRWSDVIVGDYNYYFDLSALLHALAAENDWSAAVLVDEAHNLVERGRAMYSAELDPFRFGALRRQAPSDLKKPLDRINRAWNALNRDCTETYTVRGEPPATLVRALTLATGKITDYLAENPADTTPGLQEFLFDALHFARVAELFGNDYLFDLTRVETAGRHQARRKTRLCLRNVVPARFLAERFAASAGSVLFSGTLSPAQFYADMLGLPDRRARLVVPSPFDPAKLSIRRVAVSTRYRDRGQSLQPIVEIMAGQFRNRPGNYLAFFSSYAYLEQVANLLRERHGDIPLWRQVASMGEADRSDFLARFEDNGEGIGMAVLGGAFAEGVDLPGRRLIGAFIATLGLPQWNPANEEQRRHLDRLYGRGYEYGYLYPGIRKVVQAAGRVIRNHDDRGVLYLIDDRYKRTDVAKLLPSWWHQPVDMDSTMS